MKKQIARTTGRLIVMKNTMDMQNRMFVVFLVILKISDRSGVLCYYGTERTECNTPDRRRSENGGRL